MTCTDLESHLLPSHAEEYFRRPYLHLRSASRSSSTSTSEVALCLGNENLGKKELRRVGSMGADQLAELCD